MGEEGGVDCNPDLFKKDGVSLVFHLIPGPTKKKLLPMIKKNGGEVTSRPLKHIIRLADERAWISSPDVYRNTDCVWPTYIVDCLRHGELLDIERYKCKAGSKLMRTIPDFLEPMSDSMDEDLASEPPVKSQSLTAAIPKRGRIKYTTRDDMAILKYVVQSRELPRVTGNLLWNHMHKMEVTSHTGASMKARYRDHISKDIKNYEIPDSWKTYLTGGLRSSDESEAESNHEGQSSDEDKTKGNPVDQENGSGADDFHISISDEGEAEEIPQSKNLSTEPSRTTQNHSATELDRSNDQQAMDTEEEEEDMDEFDRQLLEAANGLMISDNQSLNNNNNSPSQTPSKKRRLAKKTRETPETRHGAQQVKETQSPRKSPRKKPAENVKAIPRHVQRMSLRRNDVETRRESPRKNAEHKSTGKRPKQAIPESSVTFSRNKQESGEKGNGKNDECQIGDSRLNEDTHQPTEGDESDNCSDSSSDSPCENVENDLALDGGQGSGKTRSKLCVTLERLRNKELSPAPKKYASRKQRMRNRSNRISSSSQESNKGSEDETDKYHASSDSNHGSKSCSSLSPNRKKDDFSEEEHISGNSFGQKKTRTESSPTSNEKTVNSLHSLPEERTDPALRQSSRASKQIQHPSTSKASTLRSPRLPAAEAQESDSPLSSLTNPLMSKWKSSPASLFLASNVTVRKSSSLHCQGKGFASQARSDHAKGSKSCSHLPKSSLMTNLMVRDIEEEETLEPRFSSWRFEQNGERSRGPARSKELKDKGRAAGMASGSEVSVRGTETVSDEEEAYNTANEVADSQTGEAFVPDSCSSSSASSGRAMQQLVCDSMLLDDEELEARPRKRYKRSATALGAIRMLSDEFDLTLPEASAILNRHSGQFRAARHWILTGSCPRGHHYWTSVEDQIVWKSRSGDVLYEALKTHLGKKCVQRRKDWLLAAE